VDWSYCKIRGFLNSLTIDIKLVFECICITQSRISPKNLMLANLNTGTTPHGVSVNEFSGVCVTSSESIDWTGGFCAYENPWP